MPPIPRPFPRFIADPPHESKPYGRWEERLTEEFAKACSEHVEEAGAPLDPETLKWFPERSWSGRVYVPATAGGAERQPGESGDDADSEDAGAIEYFGWVSFERPEDGEPVDLRASADYTDVTAEENPDWRIDLSDDVIGRWNAEGERGGDITLVWGLPLVRGAIAAIAELDGEVIDQAAVTDGRFTLVAVDAVSGFGDDLYVEVKLWNRTLRPIASESLYAE